MDASIDIKTVLTLLGVLASVIGAAAVARAQIKALAEQLSDVEARLRKMDTRTDRLHTQIETQQQKLLILSGMMSPDHEAVRHREAANILCRIARLEKDVLE
jgi:hypothetical protein